MFDFIVNSVVKTLINTYKLHNDARVFVLKMDNKSVTLTTRTKGNQKKKKKMTRRQRSKRPRSFR
jgi:hypothetical protein